MHVYSRTSPTQKGIIVGLLNSLGHKTLMCGDGTNDVGSLKRADVGLAIVNNKDPSKEDIVDMKIKDFKLPITLIQENITDLLKLETIDKAPEHMYM